MKEIEDKIALLNETKSKVTEETEKANLETSIKKLEEEKEGLLEKIEEQTKEMDKAK